MMFPLQNHAHDIKLLLLAQWTNSDYITTVLTKETQEKQPRKLHQALYTLVVLM